MFGKLKSFFLSSSSEAVEASEASVNDDTAKRRVEVAEEIAAYQGHRVDFTALLPVDILLRVVLALNDPQNLLSCAHVCARMRRCFFVRNAFGQWLQLYLTRRQGKDCLLVALDSPSNPVEDPLALPVPLVVHSFEQYLVWAFGARRLSVEDTFALLARGQVGGKEVLTGGWSELHPSPGEPVSRVCVLLPAGVHPPVWVSKQLLGLSQLVLLGPQIGEGGKGAAVLSNSLSPVTSNFPYNCLTVVAKRSWNSLTELQKRDGSFCEAVQELCVSVSRVGLVPDSAVAGVFAARACGPGARLELRQVLVRGGPLSGVICDRGAQLLMRDCEVADCKQNGVYCYESSEATVQDCRFSGCLGNSVSICLLSIGTARVSVKQCWMRQNRETAAVTVRTRANSCSLLIEIEKNKIEDVDTAIVVWSRGEHDEARRDTDDPLAACDHGDSCPGCRVLLQDNNIPNPMSHGVTVGGPANPSNKTSILIARNAISHCRPLAILVARPDQPHTQSVSLVDNLLSDTGEERVLSFPGLRACVENNKCSRNVTGKRYELQAFFRCEQCEFLPTNNLGICASCAHICHAGHTGLYLYGIVAAYCDCPEGKHAKCTSFTKDPLYKEDKPEDYL